MNEALIKVENVSKIYNKGGGSEVIALDNVSLEVFRGEFVALMGASGSGKSSLLNLIGCLDKATSGNILLNGTNTRELGDEEMARIRNSKIGFVFQSFNLLPRTTARENVELPLVYSDKRGISRLAQEALEAVGLGARLHHFPAQLSGGEQQRVAIARALINDPEIILADEPTGNLDLRSSYEIMAILQKLNSQGRTVILVTHEQDVAEHTKRIIRILDGAMVSDEINTAPRKAESELNKLTAKEVRT